MMFSKKLIAGTLAAMMTLGTAVTSLAAVPTDAVDSPYVESIETLGALGIMVGDDDGKFRPDDSIRRSEFAKVAVTAMGLDNVAASSSYKTKFPDVHENHWANGYINVATQQGIVIGDDEGNFRPDDSISYAEAMTILVRIIGHGPAAETRGGFPTGYMVVGAQNGLSKNASAGANEAVKRGMVSQMTFNALTAKMMEQTGFGNNEKYEVVDKTLLSDVLGVEKGTGQITAVGISSISGNSSLKDNEVRIGDKVYTASESALPSVRNLLGFNVTYYVAEDQYGDDELILARAGENQNNAITVTAANFESISAEDGENTVIKYWQNKETDKKAKELVVSSSAKMIFNGKAIDFDAEKLQPQSGRTTFLDIDGDDVYDLCFVTSLSNIVVEDVLTNSHKITDKYGNPSLILDPKDKDTKFTIIRAGQVISLSDLKEWDVLSVAKSVDGSIISIEVSTASVSGMVTEIEGDYRTIGGKQYEIAKNYKEDIKLGDEGTFYLDIEGKIAAVDASRTLSSNYAYVSNAALSRGFDQVLEVKVFNKNGEVVILKSGEKIAINGVAGKTPAEALATLQDRSGNIVPQLITYEVNANGVLTQLNLAKDLTSSGAVDNDNFSKNASGEMTYNKSTKKLGAYRITDSTLILNIPAGETDPTNYSVEKADFFSDKETYNVTIFDATEDFTAQVVIVASESGNVNVEAPLAIIDQIVSIQNVEGERVQKLYVYQNGERVSFETTSLGLLVNEEGTALKRGDIVQLKLNNKNEITGIRVLFEADNKGTEFSTTIGTDLDLIYGRVIKKFASSINVQVGEGDIVNYSLDNVKVYELNTGKKTGAIRVVDANEITNYDELDPSRVLIKLYKNVVSEIVIVK